MDERLKQQTVPAMLEATAGSPVYVRIWINDFNRRCRLNFRQGRSLLKKSL
jgi:hypothetical protein